MTPAQSCPARTTLQLELTLEAESRRELDRLGAALALAWPPLARLCGLSPAQGWVRGFEPEGDETTHLHGVLELVLPLQEEPAAEVLDHALTELSQRLWHALAAGAAGVHLEDLEISAAGLQR